MIIVGTSDVDLARSVAVHLDEEVSLATTLQAAIDLALEMKAAVVVLDHRLGGDRFRSVEAAVLLESYLPKTVTLILSERPGHEEHAEARRLGAYAVLDRAALCWISGILAKARRERASCPRASRRLH